MQNKHWPAVADPVDGDHIELFGEWSEAAHKGAPCVGKTVRNDCNAVRHKREWSGSLESRTSLEWCKQSITNKQMLMIQNIFHMFHGWPNMNYHFSSTYPGLVCSRHNLRMSQYWCWYLRLPHPDYEGVRWQIPVLFCRRQSRGCASLPAQVPWLMWESMWRIFSRTQHESDREN